MENNKEPYAKNLYQAKNIIGYTGKINKNPTVYFKNGNQFGHITQDHPNKINIGRGIGLSSSRYTVKNNKTTNNLEEAIDGRVFHKSHNPLIKTSNPRDIKELSKAIANFPELKPYMLESAQRAKRRNINDPELNKNPLRKAKVQFTVDLREEAFKKRMETINQYVKEKINQYKEREIQEVSTGKEPKTRNQDPNKKVKRVRFKDNSRQETTLTKPLISEFGKERMQQFKKNKEAKLETNLSKPTTLTKPLISEFGKERISKVDLKQESLKKDKPLISEFGKERMQQLKKNKEAKLETNLSKPKTMTDLLSAMAGPAINTAQSIPKSDNPKKSNKNLRSNLKRSRNQRKF